MGFRPHFLEYLCFLIRENGVETLSILSTSDLETIVRRANRRLPVRPYVYRQDITIANSIFHRELIKVFTQLLIQSVFLSLPFFFQKQKKNYLLQQRFSALKHKIAVIDRAHFVEYLVSIVAKANIDPLPILDLTDCVQELRRSGIALPDRGPW